MTLPNERTRSLKWGRGSLVDICSDDMVDASLRSRAQQILARYPEDSEIQSWAEGRLDAIAIAPALALADAAQLFREVGPSGTGTAQTRHRLLYTQRHFPNANEFERWTNVIPFSPLTHWLA